MGPQSSEDDNPGYKYQSASLGKTFTRMLLQLAVDKGLIKSAKDRMRGTDTLDSAKGEDQPGGK